MTITQRRRVQVSATVLSIVSAGFVTQGHAQSWTVDGNGDWGTAANWSPATVPNGVDAAADLAPVITAPRTIALDVPVTLGDLTVRGGVPYTLAGPGTLTFDVSVGNATLTRLGNGGLVVQTDVVLNDQLAVSIPGTGFVQTFGDVSGTGGIEKLGTGTLFLRSSTSYSGGTTITEGTLAVAPSALQGNVVNNALLDFRLPTDTTYAGAISGSGAVLKTGAGALTLTGANTYSGGTTIQEGTLVAGPSALPGDVVNNAALDFRLPTDATFAGAISGSGAVLKTGAGALTLTGANTYSGGTTIQEGTLVASTSTLPGDVINNATLAFDQAVNGIFNSVISGSGDVVKSGAGSLQFTGVNTYGGTTTILAGALFASSESLPGPITNNGELFFTQTSDGTFSDVISGTGQVFKTGSGTLTLSAANTYTGSTTISDGTLNLEGSIAGDLDLFSAGRLSGNGSVAGMVSASGVIAPGTSIGTLTFGSLSLSGQYEVEYRAPGAGAPLVASGSGQSLRGRNVALDAGLAPADQDADLILVAGAAALSPSATVVLRPLGATADFDAALALPGNTNRELRYLILRADGGVTGTFVALSNSGTTLEYLSAGGSAEDVWLILRGPDTPVLTGSAPAPFLLPIGLPRPRCDLEIGAGRSCAIASGSYASKRTDADGTAPGTEVNGGAGLLGFAYGISDEMQVGVALLRETGDLSLSDASGTGDLDRRGVVAWAEWTPGALDLRGWLGVADDDVDSARTTALGSTARAGFGARQATLGVEARRWTALGPGLEVTPVVGLAAGRIDQDGYTETGGGAEDFTAASSTRNSLQASLGVEVRGTAPIVGTSVDWSAAVGLSHEFADVAAMLSGTYAGDATGTVLTSAGPDTARTTLNMSLGATVAVGENSALRLGYDFTGSGERTDHGASLRLSMRF